MDEAIGKLQDNKCPGLDGIDGPIVKKYTGFYPPSGSNSRINVYV